VDPIAAPQNASLPTGAIEQEVAALYHAHADGLFHYAASLLPAAEDARDALQEVFLRYFLERSCGGSIDNPRAWLYRVLRNYFLDWLDTAARKREIPGLDADEFPATGGDPEALMGRSQVAAHIRSVLSDRELNCLLLRAQGLSYSEIADVLNLRSGTVGVYLTRAQKKMKKAAEEDGSFRVASAHALAMLSYEAACC
jgi:RNA polymerase sigma-70 factor (ECF subfamily)